MTTTQTTSTLLAASELKGTEVYNLRNENISDTDELLIQRDSGYVVTGSDSAPSRLVREHVQLQASTAKALHPTRHLCCGSVNTLPEMIWFF